MRGIDALPNSALSGEGNLYAGVATLALLYDVGVTNGHPELLSGPETATFINDAVDHFSQGRIEPDYNEWSGIYSWLSHGASFDSL